MIVILLLLAGATDLVANLTFGQGDGPIVAYVACSGTENELMDCLVNTTHGCVHEDDMALRCTATSTGKPHIWLDYCHRAMMDPKLAITEIFFDHPSQIDKRDSLLDVCSLLVLQLGPKINNPFNYG